MWISQAMIQIASFTLRLPSSTRDWNLGPVTVKGPLIFRHSWTRRVERLAPMPGGMMRWVLTIYFNLSGGISFLCDWQDEANTKTVQCRQDWMQTATHIVVNVYCKKYDPCDDSATYVEVNPIRLRIRISFPPDGAPYTNDMELKGVRFW